MSSAELCHFSDQYNSYELIISIKFQIIVGSCSALIKEESENPKLAENLTVYLPDFSSGAIKSLLCLMYTGNLLYNLLYWSIHIVILAQSIDRIENKPKL